MNRRSFLTTAAAAAAATATPSISAPRTGKRLGFTVWSYNILWRQRNDDNPPQPAWKDALDVLDHCQEIDAGCLQIGVRGWEKDFAKKVRDKREDIGVILEGQISLPKKEKDVERFKRDLLAAKEAGASVLRTVCLGGRRYETFQSLDDWKKFVQDSRKRIEWAEPLVRKHQLKLAVENHKDWRIPEFLDLLGHIDSEWVGVNFDFGNNLALLEHPHAVAEALAPYTMTTHIKDMAMAEHEDGFLLSEVPLGEGILDLRKMMDLCEKKNPDVQFNLEMITRDPLQVPVLTEPFYTTLGDVAAADLSATLRLARGGSAEKLPTVEGRSDADKIAFEAQNVIDSFVYAKKHLQLA